jgi:TetR/AcrR family transcriptional regulator
MGPLPARKHDADASRAAILEAAEALFVARGFSAISLSEIAERSGVTKSLIHHHFGAKEALWAEVKRRRFTSYHAQQMALYERGTLSVETLEASMAAYFRFLLANLPIVRMIAWMRLEGDHDCADLVVELRTKGLEQIALAQRMNIVRADVPASHVLMVFLALVHAYFEEGQFVAVDKPVDPDAYLATAWSTFAAAMLVNPS